MSSIAENVKIIRERMAAAALRAGREPSEIRLCAATKMNDAERVREAVEAGVDICGENRVQELTEKYEQGAYGACPLHFIGTLQKNKVKYLIGKVALIESVGSLDTIETINRRAAAAGLCQDILLEVNIGREEAKSGVLPEALDEILAQTGNFPAVRVLGLMSIPPICDNLEKNRRYFSAMRKLFIDIGAKKYDNVSMNLLSMGMSADFETAIEEGANIVRVGTGIFGARHY